MHCFIKTANLWQLFLIFSRTVLCRELWFFELRSVFQNAKFKLLKTTIGNDFKFFTLGVPYGQNFANMVSIPKNWKTKVVLKIGQRMD